MTDMNLNPLLEAIVADYGSYNGIHDSNVTGYIFSVSRDSDVLVSDSKEEQRVFDFARKLSFKAGKKYIKIISNGSAWGFVVSARDGKFARGTILKAASWAAPATNRARGNVLVGDLTWVSWTGPAYIR